MDNIRLSRNLERALKEIEDHLTRLYRSISTDTRDKKQEDQKIRVTQKENGEWQLEIKTNKGWVISDSTSTTAFKLKE
jgi:hypothetical protein